MNDIRWIKLSTDLFNNRKILQIEQLPDGDTLIVIWLKLLILAGKINDDGLIYFTPDIPYTDEIMAHEFQRPITTIRLALNTFQRFGMIEIVDDVIEVSNWQRYQSTEGLERVREQNRIRKQNQRLREHEKKAAQDGNLTVTNEHNDMSCVTSRDCHALDKNREEKKRIDKNREKESCANLFDAFWVAYPNKKGKGAAKKAFDKAIRKTDINTMLKAIAKQINTSQWTKEGGKYIPYPSTWLNQERWSDKVEDWEVMPF